MKLDSSNINFKAAENTLKFNLVFSAIWLALFASKGVVKSLCSAIVSTWITAHLGLNSQ